MDNNRLGFADVRTAAAGRWETIHRALGVSIPNTTKHTACPGCGGKDRFRLDKDYQQSGRWICGGGGDFQQGDGFALLAHVQGWTLAESLRAVADHLGLTHASDFERQQIKRKAAEQSAKLEAAARAKEEQARTDSNLLAMLENLIDSIKHRQHLQRAVNGVVTVSPTTGEIEAAQELNAAILENYAGKQGVDYDRAA
ncbi:primase-helicase zinc-binding domain-containing protein [Candidatus Thiothrix sp. Deng01]|uniref:Primase-helicase zinc-binding domain-containing protein n=1 Tax=Candidatus Thiothrix phosphatis TaxID=3112415 RepID=A0ABU6CT67_9GAMM|nr:primase-helicase zinc-binding domain-containing protein [Candidatus Thiothrix sp. Deng01]MEB4589354.1 primase-helicase zinc-binding domain-containing protein [Candidatus Thiothrix sp. Deng01]